MSISLELLTGPEIDDGGKWRLLCEVHGGVIQDTNKQRLLRWKNSPQEWCPGCRSDGE